MQSVLLILEELEKIDETYSVLCSSGFLERVSRLDSLPRRGDRTRFIIRDATAEAVYRVAWRRSDVGRRPVISLELVSSSGEPEQVEKVLLKAGFRPVETECSFRRESVKRLMQCIEQLRSERVRLQVQQSGSRK